MDKIPVKFEYKEKEFQGILSRVSGGGSNSHYHLMIGNRFHGQLFNTTTGWRFGSQDHTFEELGTFFGEHVEKYLRENFYITLRRNYKDYKIHVKRTIADERREQYSVIGHTKTIVVENNRPLWLSKQVRHRMDWKYISGEYKHASDIEDIFKEIEEHIKK